MMNVLWLVGWLTASQWGLSVPFANTEKGLVGGAAVGSGVGVLAGRNSDAGVIGGICNDRRLVTCWDHRVYPCDDAVNARNRLSLLKGSVYLHAGSSNQTICANGTMLVEASDRDGRKIAEWRFDAASLEKLKRTDRIGVGYTLCLPLDQNCLAEKDLRLTLKFRGNDGHSCCDEPTRVTLRSDAPAIVQAVHEEQLFLGKIPPIPGRGDCGRPQQIMFRILMAQVSPAAMKHLKLEVQASAGNLKYGIVKNEDGVMASLQTLRSQGFAKIICQPNLVTLNGQLATFRNGGKGPVFVLTGKGPEASFEPIGHCIELLPTITEPGMVHVKVRPEIAMFEQADGAPIPSITKHTAPLAVNMKNGQSLLILASDFVTEQGEKQDLVIVVTPEYVTEPCSKGSRQTTFTDIVTMSKRGISDDIIIRQIVLTESIYNLTTEQILSLHDQGVSNAVIRAMQERRTYQQPFPTIHPKAKPKY